MSAAGEESGRRLAAGGNHDCRPANKLDDICGGEEAAAVVSEGAFDGLHGGEAGLGADEARRVEQHAADDMADDDGGEPLGEAQRRDERPREDFGNGDGCPKPDEAVAEDGGL